MKFINNIIRDKSLVSNLVFCITAFLLFACGSGGSGGSGDSGSSDGGRTGSIAFTLDIQDNLVASSGQLAAANPTSDHALIASIKQSSLQLPDPPLTLRLSRMLEPILPSKLLSYVWFLSPTIAYADSVSKIGGLTSENALLLAQTQDDGIDCEAHELGEIEAFVYDEEGIIIAEGGPWPCDKEPREGTIEGVPAGDNRKVVIFATDEVSGEYVYRGEKGSHDNPITVLPGKTTIVGKIILDPMEPPNAPEDFEASYGEFTDRIELSWQDVKHEDGYIIYLLIPDEEPDDIGYTSMDTTVYVVSDLPCTPYGEPPIHYNYMVRAYNDADESQDSNTDSGFTDDCPIVNPYPPFDLNASEGDFFNKIELTWEWSGDGPLDEFRIYRSESPEGPWGAPINRPTAGKRKYEDSDLECTPYGEPPIFYYYIVRAYNSAGESESPESVSGYARCTIEVPDPPYNVRASDGEFSDKIEIEWKWEGKPPLDGFRIYRSESPEGPWKDLLVEVDAKTRKYSDEEQGCNDDTTYYYLVTAYNSEGESDPDDSELDSGTTRICSPQNVKATEGMNQVSLSWDKVPNATSYKVYWTSPTGDSFTFHNITSTTFVHDKVSTRRNYYAITAVSGSVESDKSEEVSAFPWLVSTIDSEGDVGKDTSIAVDSENNVHISYYDAKEGVMYATNASGSWDTETVDSLGEGFTSITLDSKNVVHISYIGYPGVLYYAMGEYGFWGIDVAYDDTWVMPKNTSIEIGTDGIAYISYVINYSDWPYIQYVFGVIDDWNIRVVDYGEYASLALDTANIIHMSYYDIFGGVLKYYGPSGADVDTKGNVGEHSAIALDSNDKVHISYHDHAEGGLKYATNSSGEWAIVTLEDRGEKVEVGIDTSIAIDPIGKDTVHVSYYDAQTGTLKYATNASGEWDLESVDNSLGESENAYTSIAIDALFNVHISYYDGAGHDFKYATKAIR